MVGQGNFRRLKRRLAAIGFGVLLLTALAEGALAAPVSGPRIGFVELDRRLQITVATVGPSGSEQRTVRGSGSVMPIPFSGGAWSPDGRSIYFSAFGIDLFSPEPWKQGDEGIYVVSAGGGKPRLVPGTGRGYSPVVSPDGRWLAFSRPKAPPSEPPDPSGVDSFGVSLPTSSTVWIAPLQGEGEPRRLVPLRRGVYLEPTSFSPNGSTLALTRSWRKGSEVVAISPEGGSITTIATKSSGAAFSPDGIRIAFTSYRDQVMVKMPWGREASNELYVMNADGTGPVRLTHNRRGESSPSWDPSGQRLAYARRSLKGPLSFFSTDLFTINADGTCASRVFKAPRSEDGKEPTRLPLGWQPGPGRGAAPISC